ncbi:hypothetical protein RND71_006623 [Anisodus tanguticus]|uniref:Uncharacterized protein n=1 Tax=Anisodus tanguticus TaxID=243964 RepID=A0AAE1SUA3_9SOLA|nr:hypothetical protein RND71_006623 [Anisodus tanguticus]
MPLMPVLTSSVSEVPIQHLEVSCVPEMTSTQERSELCIKMKKNKASVQIPSTYLKPKTLCDIVLRTIETETFSKGNKTKENKMEDHTNSTK